MAPSEHLIQLGSYETLVHALSGAAGSVTAMTVFYPLDTVRSRLQVEDHRQSKNTFIMIEELMKEEGFLTLYRGLAPVLVSLCCSNFVYFYTFHGLRAASGTAKQNALGDLFLGSVAGVVNVLTTTPLWVVNTRIKMQGVKLHSKDKVFKKHPNYTGIFDGLVKISQQEGPAILWSGTLPSLLLVVNPAVQFMVYEGLKRWASREMKAQTLRAPTYFLIGAVAKSVATILTYPLQIVQSKLRYGDEKAKKLSMFQVIYAILKSQGIYGLFKGLEAKLLQTVLTAALMFLCYEKIATFVFHVMRRQPALRRV